MAYNDTLNQAKLNDDNRIYYDSIYSSKSGNLIISLEKINFLIKKFPKNFFFLETKGDILRSHGYLNESAKFYKIVLNKFPDNYYIKYKIFLDTNTKNMKSNDKINFFYENLNLIIKFPKNKYIINKFIKITKDLEKIYWLNFFNIINDTSNKGMEELHKKLNILSKETNEIKLKNIINEYNKL